MLGQVRAVATRLGADDPLGGRFGEPNASARLRARGGTGPVDDQNARACALVDFPVSRRHLLMLLALAALWGASFMFIKICVRELGPTTLVCLRLGIGSLVLAPFAVARVG